MPTQYILVSLPIHALGDDPLAALGTTIGRDNGELLPFAIPSFKIGTLDGLVQHADDLAKLGAGCEAVVSKVSDSLKSILDGDEEKAAEQKMVNDSKNRLAPEGPLFLRLTVTPPEPTDHYLRSFQWNKSRYRADRPLGELIENLQKELQNIDNDVKSKFVQYTNVKANLAALQRKQT